MSYFFKKKKKTLTDHEEGSSRGGGGGGGGGDQKTGEGITSSMDKFSAFGFLTPALVLVPAADGVRYDLSVNKN